MNSKEKKTMKEFKIRYMWNGKVYAEPRMAETEQMAVLDFISDIYADTNSWERIKAGFKLCM